MQLKKVDEINNLSGKTVLLRLDTDVEIENGKIIDETRLKSTLLTINYLLKNGANIVGIGHLGRPDADQQIKNKEFSLEPIAQWFAKELHVKEGIKEEIIGEFPGWKIGDHFSLLENIRFFKGEEELETKEGEKLSKDLSLLADLFVNEAFAVSHRNHASVVGVTKYLSSYAGFHLAEEVEVLSKILKNPKRPLVVLIGGIKIETKLPLVEKMHHMANYVLVGGEIAEQDKILIKVQHERMIGQKSAVLVADLKENGKDITEKSLENFIQIINLGRTIVWNGPMGLIGNIDSEKGTKELAKAIVKTQADKIVGGGDTVAYLKRIKLDKRFDFISTGGGAMLELLSGKKPLGISPLLKE